MRKGGAAAITFAAASRSIEARDLIRKDLGFVEGTSPVYQTLVTRLVFLS
jgi:hypothetical protein